MIDRVKRDSEGENEKEGQESKKKTVRKNEREKRRGKLNDFSVSVCPYVVMF